MSDIKTIDTINGLTGERVPDKEAGPAGHRLNRCQCRVDDGHQSSDDGKHNGQADAGHRRYPQAKVKKVRLPIQVLGD